VEEILSAMDRSAVDRLPTTFAADRPQAASFLGVQVFRATVVAVGAVQRQGSSPSFVNLRRPAPYDFLFDTRLDRWSKP
jgi:hypothetical protein